MECRVVGGLDAATSHMGLAWDAADLGQAKRSKFHCGISDKLGLWAFASLFSFWALVHCSFVDAYGAAATNAYEGSLCGLGLPQEGAEALPLSWRGEASASPWAGLGLGIGGGWGMEAALQGGTLAWH